MNFDNVEFKLDPNKLKKPLYHEDTVKYIWETYDDFFKNLKSKASSEAEKATIACLEDWKNIVYTNLQKYKPADLDITNIEAIKRQRKKYVDILMNYFESKMKNAIYGFIPKDDEGRDGGRLDLPKMNARYTKIQQLKKSNNISEEKLQKMEADYNFDKELNDISINYLEEKISDSITKVLEKAFEETTNNKYLTNDDFDLLVCRYFPNSVTFSKLYDKKTHYDINNCLVTLSQLTQNKNLKEIAEVYKKQTNSYFKHIIKTNKIKKKFLEDIFTTYAKIGGITRGDFPNIYKQFNVYKELLAEELLKHKQNN